MKFWSSVVLVILCCCFSVNSDNSDPSNDFKIDIISPAKSLVDQIIDNDPLLDAIATIFDENRRKKKQERAQLSVLNVDCILLILNEFKFEELLNVAQVNRNFAMAAAYLFRIKYSKNPIYINTDFECPKKDDLLGNVFKHLENNNPISDALKFLGLKKKEATHREEVECIRIFDYNMIVDTFKYLEVVNLKVHYLSGPYEEQARILGELISNYASDTLQTLSFDSGGRRRLDFITKPLLNAKTIEFDDFGGVGANMLPSNELMPAVERLKIRSWNVEYFYTHMPRLTHLIILSQSENRPIADFEEILRKNPQIRSIELSDSNKSILQFVNSLLPGLESLTLLSYSNTDPTKSIQFKNVTMFDDQSCVFTPKNFHFPNLHVLKIGLQFTSYTNQWIDFLREHDQITEIHVNYKNKYYNYVLHTILDKFRNLTKVYIFMEHVVPSVNSISNLLENNANLRLFQLTFPFESKKRECQSIREQFNELWQINEISNGFIFEYSG